MTEEKNDTKYEAESPEGGATSQSTSGVCLVVLICTVDHGTNGLCW